MPGFNIYSDLKIKYIIGCIIGIPLLAIVLAIAEFGLVEMILLGIAYVLGFTGILVLVTNKRLNKLLDDLDNCKVKEYVTAYEGFLENCSKKSDFLISNAAVGYIHSGELERAKFLLETIDIKNKNSLMSVNENFTYLNNLCAVNIELGNKETAEKYFEQAHEMLYNPGLKRPYNIALAFVHLRNKISLDMLEAEPTLKLKYCELLLATETKLLHKVAIECDLGKTYEELGDTEKAKEHYKYAADNGGSTIYCKKAKERLEELNKE